jgi:hypothetical protein
LNLQHGRYIIKIKTIKRHRRGHQPLNSAQRIWNPSAICTRFGPAVKRDTRARSVATWHHKKGPTGNPTSICPAVAVKHVDTSRARRNLQQNENFNSWKKVWRWTN